MTLLSFPDVNVWFALLYADHVRRPSALAWVAVGGERADRVYPAHATGRVAPVHDRRSHEWSTPHDGRGVAAYDRLFEDDRVVLYPEPIGVEAEFRQLSTSPTASPKVWADAYLVAFASGCQGQVVTFDQALENRGAHCLVLR